MFLALIQTEMWRSTAWARFLNASMQAGIGSSPIPEPETYAMLLAGLGLLGFVMRRRKNTVE